MFSVIVWCREAVLFVVVSDMLPLVVVSCLTCVCYVCCMCCVRVWFALWRGAGLGSGHLMAGRRSAMLR